MCLLILQKQSINDNRLSTKKIIIVIALILLGISTVAAIVEFSIARGLIVIPQPKQEQYNPAERFGSDCTTYSTAENDCYGRPYTP